MKHPRIYRVLGFIGTDAAAFELLTAIAELRRQVDLLPAREIEQSRNLRLRLAWMYRRVGDVHAASTEFAQLHQDDPQALQPGDHAHMPPLLPKSHCAHAVAAQQPRSGQYPGPRWQLARLRRQRRQIGTLDQPGPCEGAKCHSHQHAQHTSHRWPRERCGLHSRRSFDGARHIGPTKVCLDIDRARRQRSNALPIARVASSITIGRASG